METWHPNAMSVLCELVGGGRDLPEFQEGLMAFSPPLTPEPGATVPGNPIKNPKTIKYEIRQTVRIRNSADEIETSKHINRRFKLKSSPTTVHS